MVSVRRVAPILLLAVTIPAWAAPQAATKTDTTTAPQPASKKTAKSPTKKSATSATPMTSTAATPLPVPPSTTPSPVPSSSAPTRKGAKKATVKKSTTKAAEKPVEKPAAKSASKTHPKATSHPPRALHRVGDHWTAYNPPDPSAYPANAKTYA